MQRQDITEKQTDMVAQVAATMAMENMPLTKQAYQNGIDIVTERKTADQVVEEIKRKYVNGR